MTIDKTSNSFGLTAATRLILGIDYSVSPGHFWTFNGRSISDIYEATYPLAD